MTVLVTGCAGFIGYHTCLRLLKKNKKVYGVDNLNDYYDVSLKKTRIKKLKEISSNFYFYKKDLSNYNFLYSLFKSKKIKYIVHLAAQAGVRHSIKNPRVYLNSNINGFFNIIECAREFKIKHCIFASTSSVYGDLNKFPSKEIDNTDHPLSFYAATKKSNEVMAYSYSAIYNIPFTGLRFFTVYGPLGRPDMALFKFTKSIVEDKKVYLFNSGKHVRDFTYVDDVAESILRLINKPSQKKIPYDIFNISSNSPKSLKFFLNLIEKETNKSSKKHNTNKQIGDVVKTHGQNKKLLSKIKYKPKIKLDLGIKKFTKWYKSFYKN